LGWSEEQDQQKKPANKNQANSQAAGEKNEEAKTSVKVHYAPGGQSNFSLGGGEPTNQMGKQNNNAPYNANAKVAQPAVSGSSATQSNSNDSAA